MPWQAPAPGSRNACCRYLFLGPDIFNVLFVGGFKAKFPLEGIQLLRVDSPAALALATRNLAIGKAQIPQVYTKPLGRKLPVLG